MTIDEIRKEFFAAGAHGTGYMGMSGAEISWQDFEKFAKKITEGAADVTPMTPETLFHAMMETQGKFESVQDQVTAILKKLTEVPESKIPGKVNYASAPTPAGIGGSSPSGQPPPSRP